MSFFTTIFVLSIGVPITMLIYWLKIGNSIESAVDFGEFFTAFTNSLTISTLGAALTRCLSETGVIHALLLFTLLTLH